MLKKALTSVFKVPFQTLPVKSLHNTFVFGFARRVKEKKTFEEKFKEAEAIEKHDEKVQTPEDLIFEKKPRKVKTEKEAKEEKVKPEKKTISKHEHRLEDRMDPKSEDIDDKWMSKCYLNTQHLPKELLRRCHQVFSKFPHEEVRKMGIAYVKLYQVLHASEKPTDLTVTKPFANTEELTETKQALIYLGKKRRHEEAPSYEEEEKAEKKREKAKKKEAESISPEKKADQGLVYDQNMALAYLQRKMPHTFGVACRIITEIRYRLPDFEPQTFLDFGAGLGNKILIDI